MRIVQLANFVGPTSGGIRTTVAALGRGYAAAGHEPVLIVPGGEDSEETTADGVRITLRAPTVPASGGYRVIVDTGRLQRLVAALAPDRVEVSDRLTLRGAGRWAREWGVPAVVFSHERLDMMLRTHLPSWLPSRRAADRLNRSLAANFDAVICTTRWAAEEFERIGTGNLVRVPLGVDLDTFHPSARDDALRARLARPDEALLVTATRLSPEKRPELAVGAVAALVRRGHRVRLVVAGDGPMREELRRRAADLPVTFAGFVADRHEMARLLATADVAVQPGPIETFGLASLEALACGTPVVTPRTGASPEMITAGTGACVYSHPAAVAAGVRAVLDWDRAVASAAARARAEQFDWSATVERMLVLHEVGMRAAVTG